MKKTFRVVGLIASFIAITVIAYGATSPTENVYTLTASGDTFGASNSSPRPKLKEVRIVTIAGPKSFILKANYSGAPKIWEHYNLYTDANTSISVSTTATATIRFTEGVTIPQAGLALTTDDTSCTVYAVVDKDDN